MVCNFVLNDFYTRKKYLPIFMDGEKLDFDKVIPESKRKLIIKEKYGCFSNAINTEIVEDLDKLKDDDFVTIHFETVGSAPKKWLNYLHESGVPFDIIWWLDDNSEAGRFVSRRGYIPYTEKFKSSYAMFDAMRTDNWCIFEID